MKALSIIQPWATLIATGAKRVETRSWSTPYRGPIAIHASKWLTSTGRIVNAEVTAYLSLCHQEPFRTALTQGGIERVRDLPSGAVVAVARLVDVRPTEAFDPDEYERAFGNYGPRRFAWQLADVQPLPAPVPHRGFPGLWDIDAQLLGVEMSPLQPARDVVKMLDHVTPDRLGVPCCARDFDRDGNCDRHPPAFPLNRVIREGEWP